MGVRLGILFGETKPNIVKKALPKDLISLFIITACFVLGRLIQYFVFDIYSSFDDKAAETIFWVVLTGIVLASVMVWFNKYIKQNNKIRKSLIIGGLLFGVDLTLFNFFMPLVFNTDISDLILRTAIDLITITLGCLSLNYND